jgi:hypothetical protein
MYQGMKSLTFIGTSLPTEHNTIVIPSMHTLR